jgi:hypothetical protein
VFLVHLLIFVYVSEREREKREEDVKEGER